MSIYREWRLCKDWRRFFLDIEIQFAAGRRPEPESPWANAVNDAAAWISANRQAKAGQPDEYAADDTYPAHIECPEAHLGHITTPAGAQDFQVAYDEKGGEAGWAVEPRNWVDQERDGS